MSVKTGVHKVSDAGMSYKLKNLVRHKNYQSFTRHHDICLMELEVLKELFPARNDSELLFRNH